MSAPPWQYLEALTAQIVYPFSRQFSQGFKGGDNHPDSPEFRIRRIVFEEAIEACLPTLTAFTGDDLADAGTTDAELSADCFET
jgi:hypothetical protein